ncbi:hypothetical protein [uncultured Tenacibaculum sp.]|uniref:hypothetical protein n=1 Tax=uncultured Tenacibaculum sp. TaxID=174713 RepID=UPI002607A926|nr:hypothetical protein [uncultured Tenacibaculum sp.]
MEKGDIVYCINESSFSDHILKRKSYVIQDIKQDLLRVFNTRNKLVWLPEYCFTKEEMPDIKSIIIDDEITDSHNDYIEVTIEFSDGVKRWTSFITINKLNSLFNEFRDYVLGNELIIVKEVNETIIKRTIIELDKKDELYEMTKEL